MQALSRFVQYLLAYRGASRLEPLGNIADASDLRIVDE
jgi:hypothetical protein